MSRENLNRLLRHESRLKQIEEQLIDLEQLKKLTTSLNKFLKLKLNVKGSNNIFFLSDSVKAITEQLQILQKRVDVLDKLPVVWKQLTELSPEERKNYYQPVIKPQREWLRQVDIGSSWKVGPLTGKELKEADKKKAARRGYKKKRGGSRKKSSNKKSPKKEKK